MADGEDRGGNKGGEAEPEERTDGWLATYSDMVTLLMCFFVLMFAMSQTDTEKMELFAIAMSDRGLTQEEFERIKDKYRQSDSPEDILFNVEFGPPMPSDLNAEDSDSASGQLGNPELEELTELITSWITDNGFGDRMSVLFDGEFLMMTLANDVWFESGATGVTPGMQEYVSIIAKMIRDCWNPEKPFEIIVEGHTDDVPINTARYPSNWYVSMERATNFLTLLMHEAGLETLAPYNFKASGCGESRPIDTNDTEEGRQYNRRVEVKISMANNDTVFLNRRQREEAAAEAKRIAEEKKAAADAAALEAAEKAAEAEAARLEAEEADAARLEAEEAVHGRHNIITASGGEDSSGDSGGDGGDGGGDTGDIGDSDGGDGATGNTDGG